MRAGASFSIFIISLKFDFPYKLSPFQAPSPWVLVRHTIVYIWKLLGVLRCSQRNYYTDWTMLVRIHKIVEWNLSFNVFFELLYPLIENAEVRASSTILHKQVGASHNPLWDYDWCFFVVKTSYTHRKNNIDKKCQKYHANCFFLDLDQIMKKT